jgi:signal transduction histidine kinase
MQLQPAMLRSVPNVAATTVRDTRLPLAPGADFRVLARGTTDAEGHQLFVYAATNLSPLNRSLRNVGNLLRYVVPALIWIVGLTTWWIVGRSLGRVEAMRAEVADITASSLERRVPRPAADDELGRLAGTMNAMLERIESAAARQRQFIGDASHELQSPLAASRTQLEVALTYPERAEWAQVAADVLREHDRMEQLVRDLLLLARVDESALVDSRRPVELGELVCGEAARLTNGHGATIDLTGVAPITVTGDPLALARVVSNLLENACRHAASDVWVSVEGDGNDVVLTVEDDGPGVPLVERSRIFERFARVEHARARDAGGTGLGLAIVKDVVEAHGGSVAVADGARGARFTVTLPRRTPDPSSS